jgi:hypothetical protein
VTPMRIKRTLWLCPKCSELKPTRHENVVRHINRKHGAVGEPISVTTGQTRSLMLALGLLSTIRKSFMGKSISSQEFYDNPSPMLNYKNKNIDTPTESSDTDDKYIMLRLVSMVKDTQQAMQTIMVQNSIIINYLNENMMYVPKPTQPSNDHNVGNFA